MAERALIIWTILCGLFLFVFLTMIACAADCPAGVPSCKVLVLTPDEERALTGQNMILDTAQQGRALELTQIANYFRQKILTAPQGEVKRPAAAPAPEVKP